MPRCFIGFFGITRGLQWTAKSVEANVFRALDRAGVEQVRAAHFNLPQVIDAPRSGEKGVPFLLGDLSPLKLDRTLVEEQEMEKIEPELALALAVPFKGEDDPGGIARRNAVFQLHSLRRLATIFAEMEPESFDAVLLLRPDLRYLDPLPIKLLLAQLRRTRPFQASWMPERIRRLRRRGRPEADIVVPAWHRWGGLNDRFAFATPAAALAYMNRIDNIGAFCAAHSYFHPESLLAFSMERAGMQVATTFARAERVRSDGSVALRDIPRGRERRRIALTHRIRRALQI